MWCPYSFPPFLPLPPPQAAKEWDRYLRQEEQREERRLKKLMGIVDEPRGDPNAMQTTLLASGVRTAAEQRPNAYVPDADGELPLPRPYGQHAPFKPPEPPANLRHFRKTVTLE